MERPFAIALATLLAGILPVQGLAQEKPEVKRSQTVIPQAIGARHTLRVIPEACAMLVGAFTGDPGHPYDFSVVKTDPRCMPRAKLVEATQVNPAGKPGWRYNDELRVPNASCPGQAVILRVWRNPGTANAVPLDVYGGSRIYMEKVLEEVRSGKRQLPEYALALELEGKCP